MDANLGRTTPFARVVYDYPAFIEAMRDRTVDLGISRLETDRIAGLPIGFSGKALSRNPVKRIGLASLGPLLETLGLIIMIVEDPAARDRTLARRVPVDVKNQRFDNKSNSPKLISAPSNEGEKINTTVDQPAHVAPQRSEPPVSRAHLRVIQGKRRGSKYG